MQKGGLCIQGALKYAKDYSLYVSDDGRNYALIVRDSGECIYITGQDAEFARQVFDEAGEVFTLGACEPEVAQLAKSLYTVDWWRDCMEYVYDGNPIQHEVKREIKPLTAKYWQRVSDGTPYKPPEEEVVKAINTRLSCAVYEDGQPVCWCIVHEDDSMGMLYTLPEYRHRGLALDVMTDMVRQMSKRGAISFGHIVKGNEASVALAKKYNLVFYRDCVWTGIKKR